MKTKIKSNIIIAVVSIFLLLIGIHALAQDTLGHCEPSEVVGDIVGTGVQILDATHNNIIPNVPNSVTGALITLVAGLFIRLWEKRKLRKKGKLKDEKNNSLYHE